MDNKYLKVLPLESWMKHREILDTREEWIQDLSECANKITPIFNRNGYYYDRKNKFCWFEVDGLAFKYNSGDFLYNLEQFNHTPLRESVNEAISILIKENVCNKELKRLYYTNNQWWDLRNTYRNARKYMLSRLGKFKKKNEIN